MGWYGSHAATEECRSLDRHPDNRVTTTKKDHHHMDKDRQREEMSLAECDPVFDTEMRSALRRYRQRKISPAQFESIRARLTRGVIKRHKAQKDTATFHAVLAASLNVLVPQQQRACS